MKSINDETVIIELFQSTAPSEVFFPYVSEAAETVFMQIHNIDNWNKWTDSSSKADSPPDFFCDKLQCMMEVMRVDDHTYCEPNGKIVNPANMLESKLRKEIGSKLNLDSDQVLFVNAVTDLPTLKDHNYTYYRDNFIRVVENHKRKIELYRKNHPGYKLIFFIFDESSGYAKSSEIIADRTILKEGDEFQGSLHRHWCDRAFLDVIISSDIDFLTWFTPYKLVECSEGVVKLPTVCVFDIKSMNLKTESYDAEHMLSTEI